MDSKLFARIGAGAFVAIAITMAVLELREEPAPPPSAPIAAADGSGDGAKATLAYCATLGLEAASVDVCTAAWAAERRRFLGQAERDAAVVPPVADSNGGAALDMTGDR
jgi:conjugative transfer region protein TrbK